MNKRMEGMTHITETLPDVMKEVARRTELQPRLEAEHGRPLTDAEFLTTADATG